MRHGRLMGAAAAAMLVVVGTAGCGGSSDAPTSPSGGSGGGTTVTVTIANNAVSPQTFSVRQGTRVTFVNNDTRAHDMSSDPHPTHEDCPELNQVGLLQPGQSRTSGNLNTLRVCGFHDHNLPNVAGLIGRITITAQ